MSLEGFDTLAPSVTFELLGAPPNMTGKILEQRLMQFEYLDEPRKRPVMSFQFDNSDGKIVNIGVLYIGLKMRITFGYEGLRSRPFLVNITKIHAAPVRSPSTVSPAPGNWGVIHMEGLPQTPKLHWRPELDVGTYRNMKLADIVRQIARKQGFRESKIFVQDGLALDGCPDSVYDEVSINENETCHGFLVRMAYDLGFHFYTRRDEFHFHQDNWKGFGLETIEYFSGPDLLDFTIDGDYNMNVRGVKASAIDWRKRAVKMEGVKPGESGVATVEPLQKQEVMTAIPSKLRMAAAKRLIAHSSNRWLVRTVLVGNPKVFRGTALELKNFGPFLDGHWTCVSVRHTIDNVGYTTNVGLKHIIPGKAGKTKIVIMEGPNGERGVSVIVDHGKEAGKKRKGRFKSLGPGNRSKSYRASNAQGRTQMGSQRENFGLARSGRGPHR